MHTDQILIFDADDTLWENNVIFERVTDAFLDWVAAPAERERTRTLLAGIEAANVPTLGYGAGSFRQSLADCLSRLNGDRTPTAAELARIDDLLAPLTRRGGIELIPGVADTLAALAGRHHLLLLTKGDQEEQRAKVAASTIDHHFRGIHIVAEKSTGTYRELTAELALDPARTWMIGNSPKSDIAPARAAGLRTVFIPHEHTWVLEHQELRPDEATLRLTAFPELLRHF
ncbi:HAD family hydrolase [Streptomyces rubellomurinus]|uniref:Hydrolase n=2 Tax=Streptomyces TaxID=1883 RepID=A0A0F2TBM7_STRR3|nr:HAD family hydrolase [Streptomyces rubellomurinus]KJS55241.1 hydrolase [Streptomyces rubellomurinus subsp. indigoferus]KJS60603.1 hydrolase [Streptomyces rubellomurinus]